MVATLYYFIRLLCPRLQVGLDDLQVQQGEVIKGHLQFITICLYIALLDKVSQNFFIIFFYLPEHLGLALALNVPVFVVVTKIDMCPPNVLQDTMKLLSRILKSPGCRKIPVIVQNSDDVVVSATNFVSER